MDTTPNRTGAVWVAGTGAFLLLAATALFVAVRWDDIPDAAKLGVVGALTGVFLLGGRALARTLPATGDVLFHLGALLIPIDVAAAAVRLGLGWRGLLLAEGLVAGVALAALAVASRSVVLASAAATAPVAIAAGVASISPVPAPLLLALTAVAASAATTPWRPAGAAGTGTGTDAERAEAGRRSGSRFALPWALLAGLAPLVGAVAASLLQAGTPVGVGVLTELGLTGGAAGWAALASGAIAAGVLGREARTREDGALAGLAVAVFIAGVASAGIAADLSGRSALLALPGLLVAVEAAALVARRDEFWGPIVAATAFVAEIPAVVVGWPVVLGWFLFCPIVNDLELFGDRFGGDPVAGVSLGLLGLAWFLMGARRPTAPDASFVTSVRNAAGEFPWLVAPAVVAAVAAGTASGPATAAVLVALGAVLATAPRRGARLTAGVLAVWAPVATIQRPTAALLAGLAGAAVATAAARRASRQTGPVGAEAVLLTLAAVGVGALACFLGPQDYAGTIVASLLAVGACFAVAAALEPAPILPTMARVGAALAAVGVTMADPGWALPALALATALAVADAVGRNQPGIAFGAAATVQLVVVDLARRGGLDTPETGLALCLAAVVWAGLALVASDRWRLPLLAAAGGGLACGLSMAAHDPRTGAHALLIAGGLVAAAGVVSRRPAAVGVGAVIVGLGIGSHLELSHVRSSDAYLAPVAALLLGAGFHLRRSSDELPSSWVAYAPAVALLGGAALVERMAGGGGVHAVAAGALGIAAVAAGGARRLAGPLVVGTALLVAITLHESLATLATVPTWGWLAVGGSVLLGLGVALERRGTGNPVDVGRRLVDVVAERFS